jgi:DNA-directed RNA polymerase subunit RPC12/RpoP
VTSDEWGAGTRLREAPAWQGAEIRCEFFSHSWRPFVISLFVAAGIFFVCTNCGKEIVSWDEGKPYYRDPRGTKHYAYHPDPMRDFCVGNDFPHLCLNCGADFSVDSEEPRRDCPQCHSTEISGTFALEGKPCPFCKRGRFLRDPSRLDIS